MSFPHATAAVSRLEVERFTGSTNADLLQKVPDAAGWPHLSVILTDDQRSGRGRLDRQWEAPAGASLAVSVLLRELDFPVEQRGWVPLAAGLAMADAIAAQLPQAEVGVKWPNDVLVNGRKISGILAEASGLDAIVIGAGINIAMSAEQLPVPTATSFAIESAHCDIDLLVAGYIARLDAHIAGLIEHGSAEKSSLLDAVSARCLSLGREVQVHLPGDRELLGRAVRLAGDGQIVVATADGEVSIAAGDIVHLRAA